jgi:hypothetical protein
MAELRGPCNVPLDVLIYLAIAQGRKPQMSTLRFFRALAGAAAFGLCLAIAGPATAEPPQHIRGTLTAFQNQSLTIKTPRGATETIGVPKEAGLFIVTLADLSAVQQGRFVGITSVEKGGKRVAREVHVFDESLRGLGEGHYPWDLESEPNMMTNADIARVEEAGGDRVLKLKYKEGEQTIAVPQDATIVMFNKTTPDQVVPDRKAFVVANKQPDGSLVARAVVVGADGVKPPM